MSSREAIGITGMPNAKGSDGASYWVGAGYFRPHGRSWRRAGTVTRITVTDDLPGRNGPMERVRVFDGDHVIYEAPLHHLEGVTYAARGAAPR